MLPSLVPSKLKKLYLIDCGLQAIDTSILFRHLPFSKAESLSTLVIIKNGIDLTELAKYLSNSCFIRKLVIKHPFKIKFDKLELLMKCMAGREYSDVDIDMDCSLAMKRLNNLVLSDFECGISLEACKWFA